MDMSGKTLHDLNITSPQTKEYNCIAWAAGENDRYWWPDPMESGYWPPGLRRSESIENFIEAFKTIGYECCDNENAEESYDKIAIFSKDGKTATHASRQLESGKWTSKLGKSFDVEHGFNELKEVPEIDKYYGGIVVIMKRKNKDIV